MNRIEVSGPPWLLDVAEPSDPATIVSDLSPVLETVLASLPDDQPDATVVVRAVDDRCDDLLRPLDLVPDHDRWVQTLGGPAARNDLVVRQGQTDDLVAIVELCARSRRWGEVEGADPDVSTLTNAIATGRVWVHERHQRLAGALVFAPETRSTGMTIERLAAKGAPDDAYTGPREDLDRSLALQTLKATLWALTRDRADTGAGKGEGVEIRVSVAADSFEGVDLFEAANLRYRHTDRYYRLTSTAHLG